jgi:hypothetical protein
MQPMRAGELVGLVAQKEVALMMAGLLSQVI